MSKPKNKPNAYSAFCHEWRKKEEKNKRFFTMVEAISNSACSEAWKNLSEDEKARYKALAKNTKVQIDKVQIDRKTGLGESLNDIKKAELKKKEFIDKMKEYISSITRSAKECNCIQKLTFYIIHANYLYNRTLDNNEVEYYPAEICVVRCSLENGVEDVHHVLVSEKVMKGYRSDAITHSNDTHQIPVDFAEGKQDYSEIFKEICKFLEPGKKDNMLPPLYTIWAKDNVYYPAKSILSKLATASDKYEEYLRLYAFEELFASMYNAVLDQSGTIEFESITAFREMKKDPYAYKNGLECDFHKTIEAGALYCSQSIAKRWFYVLCDFCCDPLDIMKIPGVHTPLEKRETTLALSRLNSTLSTISLNDSRYSSTLNMTNVSNDYRMRSSGRSVQEVGRRKTDTQFLADYNKVIKKLPEVKERPLRLPYSKSTLIDDSDDDTLYNESIDYSENNFPSIGRGVAAKKTQEKKGFAGHGKKI